MTLDSHGGRSNDVRQPNSTVFVDGTNSVDAMDLSLTCPRESESECYTFGGSFHEDHGKPE